MHIVDTERETGIEDYLVKRVTRAGGEVRKVQWIGRRGAPDRLVLFPEGWIYWVELKRPGKDAEAHQKREHRRLRDMDQIVLVIDTRDKVDMLCDKHL